MSGSKTSKDRKNCSKCKQLKPLADFYLCKNGKYRCSCKKCDNAMSKAYKAKSKAHISEYNKNYKAEHREEISVYNHDYNKNNRDTIQKRQTRTRRERRTNDFNFYLATDTRSKLSDFVCSKGKRMSLISTVIGCDYISFFKWLEFLFEDGMTFENYGKLWNIDHVYPVCKYDLTEYDVINNCFNWRNLRPVIKLHNSKKTNKIDNKELNDHIKLIKEFWNSLSENAKKKYI